MRDAPDPVEPLYPDPCAFHRLAAALALAAWEAELAAWRRWVAARSLEHADEVAERGW